MSIMVWGWDVISFVSGSLIVVKLGWSLALGWRPAIVFRLLWYLFGLFLYIASSCFLSFSVSFRFALLMIVEIALWHKEGMSSMLGVSWSLRMVVACVVGWGFSFLRSVSVGWVSVVCVFVLILVMMLLASFLSFVRRLSCLLSEWVRGVCIFSVVGGVLVCAIGHVFCASSWYAFSMVIICSAALSIWDVVILEVSVRLAR